MQQVFFRQYELLCGFPIPNNRLSQTKLPFYVTKVHNNMFVRTQELQWSFNVSAGRYISKYIVIRGLRINGGGKNSCDRTKHIICYYDDKLTKDS